LGKIFRYLGKDEDQSDSRSFLNPNL